MRPPLCLLTRARWFHRGCGHCGSAVCGPVGVVQHAAH
ncbi:MAG: hypothetical protein JWN04_1703, partial [Myxococcaceae bacterium]|nr:hypothetical protein [Myxococcaceae bacterium]